MKIGARGVFRAKYNKYTEKDGRFFTVTGEASRDVGVIEIMFDNGDIAFAWPEELEFPAEISAPTLA